MIARVLVSVAVVAVLYAVGALVVAHAVARVLAPFHQVGL